jgi:hypothetical protein
LEPDVIVSPFIYQDKSILLAEMGASMSMQPTLPLKSANPNYMSGYNTDNYHRRASLNRQQEERRRSGEKEPPERPICLSSNPFIVDPFIKGQDPISHVRTDSDVSSKSTASDSLERRLAALTGSSPRLPPLDKGQATTQYGDIGGGTSSMSPQVGPSYLGSVTQPSQAEWESFKQSSDVSENLNKDGSKVPAHEHHADMDTFKPMDSPPGPYQECSCHSTSSEIPSARTDPYGNELEGISSDTDGIPPASSVPIVPGPSSHPLPGAPPQGLSVAMVPRSSMHSPPQSVPTPPPLPSNDTLMKRQSNLSRHNSTETNKAENLPSLEDKWPDVIEGFGKIIQLMKTTRKVSSFKYMLEEMDKKLNSPYYRFAHKDERKRMGDYLAAETEFAKAICELYFDLMDARKYDNYVQNSTDSPTDVVLIIIRNFLWNFTDMSVKLAKRFADTGIIESLLSDVEVLKDKVMGEVDSEVCVCQNKS